MSFPENEGLIFIFSQIPFSKIMSRVFLLCLRLYDTTIKRSSEFLCVQPLESSFVSTTIVGGRGVMKSSSKSCDNLQKFLGRAVQQKEIEPSMRIRVVDSISMACKNALVNKKIVSSVYYTVYTLSPLFIMYNFSKISTILKGFFPQLSFSNCILIQFQIKKIHWSASGTTQWRRPSPKSCGLLFPYNLSSLRLGLLTKGERKKK